MKKASLFNAKCRFISSVIYNLRRGPQALDMDVQIDMARQRLVVNPESPNIAVAPVKYTQNRHKLNIQSPLSLRERVRVRAFKKFNLWRHKV
jgi:hypothetical protein